ncbi:4Fe-4S dicluster domain-containing protein [Candidatus Fermentibacteria bacterium]|nr:4Fe-4S dicluster domain-containing protein [Candidatus Fermentibacteria bacterium]
MTVRFPAGAYEAPAGYRGTPRYDEATCIGCGACAQVCPAKAIEMIDDLAQSPPVRRFTIHYDVCIFCGHCELNCTTTTGIHNTTEYDMTTFDRASLVSSVEKELVLCEGCGAVIAPREHILWSAEKLGAKQFANPTLALSSAGALGLVEPASASVHPGLRPDSVRVLCARCRRTTVVGELWG